MNALAVDSPRAAHAPARVVVIDDNRDLGDNLAEILEARGLEVAVAARGREGLEQVEALRPDVCVIDLNLPDLHGLEVLDEVRARWPQTECIVLTGVASLESAVDAVNRGAFAYGVKGLRFDDVVASIDRAIDKVSTRRALRQERALLQAILDSLPLAVVVASRQGALVRRNERAEALLGGPRAEGAPAPRAGDLAARGLTPADQDAIHAVLTGARGSAEVQLALAGSGEARTFSALSAPLPPLDAEPHEGLVVSALQDVSAERALERKARRASRLAAIGELAARIAHEIRNPLAGIAQAARVLSRGFEHDPERGELARVLRSQIGRLNTFIEDLLVLARPARLRRETVEVRGLIDTTLRALREHPSTREVELFAVDPTARLGGDARPDEPTIDADPRLLTMVLDNLVINACQMTGTSRVEVHAESRIDERGDRVVVIAVEDDGPGLAPEVIPVLFEPFETTRIEGTGLGLTTTKRIVEAHGGQIAASNRAQGGARFEISLPAQVPFAPPGDGDAKVERTAGPKPDTRRGGAVGVGGAEGAQGSEHAEGDA